MSSLQIKLSFLFFLIMPFLVSCSFSNKFKVDESYNGKHVVIPASSELSIELKATSCSDWKILNISNKKVIRLVRNDKELPESNDTLFSPICGPERNSVWVFNCLNEGTCIIEMGLIVDGIDHVMRDFNISVSVE